MFELIIFKGKPQTVLRFLVQKIRVKRPWTTLNGIFHHINKSIVEVRDHCVTDCIVAQNVRPDSRADKIVSAKHANIFVPPSEIRYRTIVNCFEVKAEVLLVNLAALENFSFNRFTDVFFALVVSYYHRLCDF
jgi:hypothetical protein